MYHLVSPGVNVNLASKTVNQLCSFPIQRFINNKRQTDPNRYSAATMANIISCVTCKRSNNLELTEDPTCRRPGRYRRFLSLVFSGTQKKLLRRHALLFIHNALSIYDRRKQFRRTKLYCRYHTLYGKKTKTNIKREGKTQFCFENLTIYVGGIEPRRDDKQTRKIFIVRRCSIFVRQETKKIQNTFSLFSRITTTRTRKHNDFPLNIEAFLLVYFFSRTPMRIR